MGATGRPAELAQLDADGATVSCTHDVVLNREIVRVRAPNYGGLPLFGPVQDALVHVDATDTIVFLHADYLPVGATVAAACLDAPPVGAGVPGEAMSYQRFNLCVPGPTESYTIASDDVIEVGAERFLVDGDGDLRRVARSTSSWRRVTSRPRSPTATRSAAAAPPPTTASASGCSSTSSPAT